MQITISGGQHDGLTFTRERRLEPYVWLDPDGRIWTSPAEGRELHCLAETRYVDGQRVVRYRNAHRELVRCDNCGWYTPRLVDCLLCCARLV